MIELFILLILFQYKHWLCDYPLQTPYMLHKFKHKGWVLPLAAHSGVHAWVTMLITSLFYLSVTPEFNYVTTVFCLGLFDFVIHFITDRIKAHPNLGGRYKQDDPKFWWCLGLDQMVHHLTHYCIIFYVVVGVN